MKNKMPPELIRLAKKQKYKEDEGFADQTMTFEFDDVIAGALNLRADDLAREAKVSKDAALSTIVVTAVKMGRR
jgi:hypothetical protein